MYLGCATETPCFILFFCFVFWLGNCLSKLCPCLLFVSWVVIFALYIVYVEYFLCTYTLSLLKAISYDFEGKLAGDDKKAITEENKGNASWLPFLSLRAFHFYIWGLQWVGERGRVHEGFRWDKISTTVLHFPIRFQTSPGDNLEGVGAEN